jgi:hypothetical protein
LAKRPVPKQLTPFKPGQSGNPGGRPKGTREFVELCRSHSDKAVKALLEALERPRDAVAAANTLLAYAHGRPVQTQNVRVIRSFEDLTEEELRQLAGMENGDDASVAAQS